MVDQELKPQIKYIFNHISEETAHVGKSYTKGFRGRRGAYVETKTWIEINSNGSRFCQRKKSLRTKAWNKNVNRSTYSTFIALFLKIDDYGEEVCSWTSLNQYDDFEKIKRLVDSVGLQNLTKEEQINLGYRLGSNEETPFTPQDFKVSFDTYACNVLLNRLSPKFPIKEALLALNTEYNNKKLYATAKKNANKINIVLKGRKGVIFGYIRSLKEYQNLLKENGPRTQKRIFR